MSLWGDGLNRLCLCGIRDEFSKKEMRNTPYENIYQIIVFEREGFYSKFLCY
jgi:hypothetical protein